MTVAVEELPLAKVEPGDNDRRHFAEDEIAELAESIKAHGLAQPITVRPMGAGWQVVAGERRLRAFRLLGRRTIPAIVRKLSDKQASAIMLSENMQRADLTPIEEARAYRKRMEEFKLTAEEVGRWAKVSGERVRSRLELLELRWDVQQLIANGHVPLGHARAMVGLDENRQTLALRTIEQSERMPTVAEFRAYCGQLLLEQQQDALFDPENFMVLEAIEPKSQDDRTAGIPVDPKLPPMRGATTVADAMSRYVQELQSGDEYQQQAARVVSHVYAGLIRSNLAGRRKATA